MAQNHITGLEVTASENNTVYGLELIQKGDGQISQIY